MMTWFYENVIAQIGGVMAFGWLYPAAFVVIPLQYIYYRPTSYGLTWLIIWLVVSAILRGFRPGWSIYRVTLMGLLTAHLSISGFLLVYYLQHGKLPPNGVVLHKLF